MNLMTLILTLAILAGQLIKIPVFSGGISILDFSIILLSLYGIYKLKFNLKKPPKFISSALVFILICIFSEIFTPLHLQPNEYFNSLFYIVRFGFYILFSWVIFSNAFPKFNGKIENVLIYSGLGFSILGLLQFVFLPDLSFITKYGFDPHYLRTVSTILDPNFAGAIFVITLILLLNSWPLNKNRSILFIPIYFALLTTFSRSSYLMFLVSGATLSVFKKSKILFIKAVILFLILLLGFQIYTQLVSKPRNINREQSASYRLSTWQQGWQLFQDHPILGIGFNSYKYALKEYKVADKQFLNSHGATSNDSSLLFVLATTGLIGLISYLYFLLSVIKTSHNKSIVGAIIIGLLFHSLFANSLFFPPILLFVLLACVIPKK